jgi:hypothetical protein
MLSWDYLETLKESAAATFCLNPGSLGESLAFTAIIPPIFCGSNIIRTRPCHDDVTTRCIMVSMGVRRNWKLSKTVQLPVYTNRLCLMRIIVHNPWLHTVMVMCNQVADYTPTPFEKWINLSNTLWPSSAIFHVCLAHNHLNIMVCRSVGWFIITLYMLYMDA